MRSRRTRAALAPAGHARSVRLASAGNARLPLVLLTLLVTSAHVGSPDAWYEGSAGPAGR